MTWEVQALWSWIGQNGETLAKIATGLAGLGAGYVGSLYQVSRSGTNLALKAECSRWPVEGTLEDYVSATVSIRKGTRQSLVLDDVAVRFGERQGKEFVQFESISLVEIEEVDRRNYAISGVARWPGRRTVSWDCQDPIKPWLNLAPGDEMQLGCVAKVPNQSVCIVQVVALGRNLPSLWRWLRSRPVTSQWRASCVSIPGAYSSSQPSPAVTTTGRPE